jgi:N-acetylglutamate synthase-like GNAT family acetyltransferase
MIRQCQATDLAAIYEIINDAATAYRGIVPADCLHIPYMDEAELKHEISSGVVFWGWEDSAQLNGVMGLQRVQDATLIRHAYVRTEKRREGIGGELLDYLVKRTDTPLLLVGTWAAARWAISFYQRRGFSLVAPDEKDRLLTRYWDISPRQKETSVVLIRKLN